jgi:hypothetical protein
MSIPISFKDRLLKHVDNLTSKIASTVDKIDIDKYAKHIANMYDSSHNILKPSQIQMQMPPPAATGLSYEPAAPFYQTQQMQAPFYQAPQMQAPPTATRAACPTGWIDSGSTCTLVTVVAKSNV